MAENSKIEWTDHTFNPWFGCTNVSTGCDNCYAERLMDTRMHKVKWGVGQPRVRTSQDNWDKPVRWNKRAAAEGVRRKVFCASLADVFDNEAPDEWRDDLFALITATPNLDWLLLTKRIGNAGPMMYRARYAQSRPLPNVWLGATVVNQEEANRDIPKLLATPAAVRFLSIEPVLGAIDLTNIRIPLRGESYTEGNVLVHKDGLNLGSARPEIDWVIVGGESGPKARDTEVDHIRSIVKQCKAADVPVFVKQMGDRLVWNDPEPDRTEPPHFMRFDYGKKGADIDNWPVDLRVRQFPTTAGGREVTALAWAKQQGTDRRERE